jgi:hypothetical protein
MYRSLLECLEALMKDREMLENEKIDVLNLEGAYSYHHYVKDRDRHKLAANGKYEVLCAIVERTALDSQWVMRPLSKDAEAIFPLPPHLVMR